jgi:hypothetical protein
MATVDGSNGIIIRRLGFDANSFDPFGGIAFDIANKVQIEKTHFFDSKPLGSNNRYSYIFSCGTI